MSIERVVRTFDEWARNGRAEGMEDEHGDVVRQVIDPMEVAPGQRILDLGCGNGWATRLLAQKNAGVQAIGIDASPQMVARAEELSSLKLRARYEVGAFEKLAFRDQSFDRVFSMESLYYSNDLEVALREAFRVLKGGGAADVIVDRFKENPASEHWAATMGLELSWLSEREWKAAFERVGFAPVSASRVHDRRGLGCESTFEPNCCNPTWQHWQDTRTAGSLWIRALKPV
jgi:ubiquinone/menaquinone biosynthesis C-methylase UbiE